MNDIYTGLIPLKFNLYLPRFLGEAFTKFIFDRYILEQGPENLMKFNFFLTFREGGNKLIF